MSLEERLMKAATKATGDPSSLDVAEFQPKGTMGATMAGAAAGSLAAGRAAVGLARDLPPFIAVAVSPTTLYLLGMRSAL